MIMLPALRRNRMNLFSEFNRMQEEVDTLFHAFKERRLNSEVGIEIWDNSEELIVTAELPGVNVEDIKTTVKANQLFIEAEFKDELTDSEEGRYLRKERKCGSYQRSFRLPYDVQNESITAEFKEGVLTVTLPKAEACKAKIIAVKSA